MVQSLSQFYKGSLEFWLEGKKGCAFIKSQMSSVSNLAQTLLSLPKNKK